MAASATDKLSRTANGGIPVVATVQANRTAGVNTLSVDTQQYWPTVTGVKFSTYKVNPSVLDAYGNPTKIAGSQIDWEGTSNGTNQLAGIIRTGGAADTGNVIGDKVQMGPTAQWADDIAAAMATEHKQDGTHGNITATGFVQTTGTHTVPAGSIVNAALANAAVKPNNLALSPDVTDIATSEATSSATYVDLATAGPSVTVTIGANGLALVSWGAESFAAGTGWFGYISFVASGANTIAVGTHEVFLKSPATSSEIPCYRTKLIKGLTAGSTTFKLQYKSPSGSSTFYNRSISVIPL